MDSESRATWHLLKPHVRPRLGVMVLVVLLGAVTSAGQAFVIMLLDPLINVILFPKAAGAAAEPSRVQVLLERLAAWAGSDPAASTDPRMTVLWVVVITTFVVAVISAAAQYLFGWLSQHVAYHAIVDLRLRLARHLMGLSVRYHGQRRLGDLLSRVSADVNATLQTVFIALKGLVKEPLEALGFLVVAGLAAPMVTLGVLVSMPIILVPVNVLGRKVRKGSHKSLTSLGASVQHLSQMFQGVRTVKAFRGEEREMERYRAINDQYLRQSMRMVRNIALTSAWAVLASTGGMALLLLAVGAIHLRWGLFEDAGTMGVFFLTLSMFYSKFKSVSRSITQVQESVGASQRLLDVLAEKVDVLERPDARPISALGAGLRFEDVSFAYAGGEGNALEHVTLEVRPGETLAIVGPSGSGKSTLVDLVCRFVDPTGGRITVDGTDLRDLRVADWTALWAQVDQVPFLFHDTIGENIRYGRPAASDAEVEAAARAAHIHDFIASLPEGYETNVEDAGSRLSGGQRQRITIARALLKNAPLLLLDEATSSLDSQSEAAVQRALDELMQDRTVIVIAHRLSTVRHATRIVVLEEGRIVELGTHDELLARGGTYARLSAMQELGSRPQPASL